MSERATSFLGPGAFFEGKLSFADTAHIDGHFRGDVRADGTLVVGESGVVESETIAVHTLVVRGSVVGSVEAKQGVRVTATGSLAGRVTTPRFAVEEGGRIAASIAMGERTPGTGH